MVKKSSKNHPKTKNYAKTKQRMPKVSNSLKLSRYYLPFSLTVLLSTTVFWSYLSSRVHSSNADQLVNPYFFENFNTFKKALIPGQHTFLLKWPVFLLVSLFGFTNSSYAAATILISIFTVASLAYLIHRIEKRQTVKATLYLVLSSMLLLIPAQPYPGGLLPVNLAMITTRNVEYILYIWCIWQIINVKRIKSYKWLAACTGMSILMASDKLFLSLALGTSVVGLAAYIVTKKKDLVSLFSRLLFSAMTSAVIGYILVISLNFLKVTKIVGSGNGPYGFISNPGQLAHGLLYAIVGLFGNLGANPAFDAAKIRDIAPHSLANIFSLGGPALVLNGVVALLGLLAAGNLIYNSLNHHFSAKHLHIFSKSEKLSLVLIWSTLVSLCMFVSTNHYYTVDARYLAIILFALFISFATFTRTKLWDDKKLINFGLVLFLAMLLSIPLVLKSYSSQTKSSEPFKGRDQLIAQALFNHKVNTLVGDYWRILPIKQQYKIKSTVTPLSGCISIREILSSRSWQPDLDKVSFAYLLTFDKGLTDYPPCSTEAIFKHYGKPNASVLIAGNLETPKEMLLFYDHGISNGTSKAGPTQSTATTQPVNLKNLASTVCPTTTELNIVAHEDDDLLFMNPEIQQSIGAGKCIRTIFLTAGDAGSSQLYWLGRELGAQAAYANMIGADSLWLQRTVKLPSGQYITSAVFKGNSKISLLFMHLPDGNLFGQGFRSSRHESIYKLLHGQIESIHTIYGDSKYTLDQLGQTLADLIDVFKPELIRTQATFYSGVYPDHSDHIAGAQISQRALEKYNSMHASEKPIGLNKYIGYPVHGMPINLNSEQIDKKTEVFLSYAKHDNGVCQSAEDCSATPTYDSYLRRQYTQ